MNNVLLVACTSVGRGMIEAIFNEKQLGEINLVGVVNLRADVAVNKANYDPYTDLVEKYGFDIYYCENVNENGCICYMKAKNPDIIIQSGWSQKFCSEILSIPRYACIGEHPAPLPRGRGAACVNWAIITGEKKWGDTFFQMQMTYDTGVIYAQRFFDIEEFDDVKTVYDKVAACSVDVLKENLPNWAKGILTGKAQNNEEATHYPRRKPSDGEFDFSQNALDVYNQIRAQARPYPGAFYKAEINGEIKPITVWRASLDLAERNDGGVNVMCGDGKAIRLIRVQVAGQAEMWARDVLC